jgi:hypothetical protein
MLYQEKSGNPEFDHRADLSEFSWREDKSTVVAKFRPFLCLLFKLLAIANIGKKFVLPSRSLGVIVIITIFCYFRQFLAKKWRFS